MNKNNICNNCGKQGHKFHQCKFPITSYGIIIFRHSPKGVQYLMIRRKDTFGYIDFIRGKYVLNNIEQIQNLFNEMTIDERENIKNLDFETIWKMMWGDKNMITQYKCEETISQKKFDALKNGIIINDEIITLDKIITNVTTNWEEPEWEFPKGRRNYQERDLDCAIREFEEETGILKDNLSIIENTLPFEEVFLGSNHKSYKHKYYLAYTNLESDNFPNYQKTEVSKLQWKTLPECLESIRSYNLEKKNLITNINKVLKEYRLY
jgi:8-oxo-dGTP pyrophosphatase MutT (NUDIX family)